MKNFKILSLFILVGILSSCSNSAKTDFNYFAKSGLTAPKFKNEKLNDHLKSFEELFNELGTAATAKNKDVVNDLSVRYSDWILASLKFKDSLSLEEQQQLTNYLDSTTGPWNGYKDQLF